MNTPIRDLIDFADDLPSLPVAVLRALRLLNDPDSDTDEIAAALSSDQALVGQLLKLANSAFYGVSRRVSTIKQALLVLGRKVVKSLVIAAAAEDYLNRPQAGYLLQKGALWEHSLAVGYGASIVAARIDYRPVEEAFVAGLLHDIGKVVLSGFLAEHLVELNERLADAAVPFSRIEIDLADVDHAQVGGLVAEHWQLPDRLVSAIRCHHSPADAGDDWRLAGVVHLANAIALSLGYGLGIDGLQHVLDEDCLERLGLGRAALMGVSEELVDVLANVEL